MAVRVEFPRVWDDIKKYTEGGHIVHDDGQAIDHDDGAVLVLGNIEESGVLAQRAEVRHLYAPGEWASAHIEDGA